jgi:hypothetical protein
MFNLDLPAFYLGAYEELSKKAWLSKQAVDVSAMPVNENILPTVGGQTKWKYVRTRDGLKLTDGNLVYSFGGLPEEFPSEDTQVSRLSDDNILDFEKDHVSKGTAQIHRSSPGNIYMTLADGQMNPTFMLQHEEGQNWRYSPAKKFMAKLKALKENTPTENVSINPEALLDGAKDQVKIAYDPEYLNHGMMDAEDLKRHLTTVGNFITNPKVMYSGLGALAGFGLNELRHGMSSGDQPPAQRQPPPMSDEERIARQRQYMMQLQRQKMMQQQQQQAQPGYNYNEIASRVPADILHLGG